MNDKKILKKLNEKREEANESGDLTAVEAISADIRLFETWVAAGQNGECPVDLEIYGMQPDGRPSVSPVIKEQKLSEPSILQAKEPVQVEPITVDVAKFPVADQSEQPAEEVNIDEIASEAADLTQETMRLELDKVRRHIEKQEWREAVALAKYVEERASMGLKENAKVALDQAQVGLNNALRDLLSRGTKARSSNNAEDARNAYQEVLNLEPSNSDARLALMELDGRVHKQATGKLLGNLRAGLKERKDIRRLGEAVYDAEALDQEGKLPDELADILRKGRAFYDETRLQMGEETTQMRFGDVKASAEAVEKLQARVAKGEKYIFDATTNTEKPSFELLREAQTLLQQASEDTAQYEINIAEKNKTLRPRYVHQRLEKALEQPFYEQDKRKLEEKLAEVSRFIQSQEQAESMQEKALQETDQVNKLALLLQAREIFGSLTGLDEQIIQVRPVAISVMQTAMSDMLRVAESFLHNQEYPDARLATAEAEKQASGWPEAQKPEEIAKLANDAQVMRKQIDTTETAWKEYTKLAKEIRQKVVDQDQRATGLSLFKQVGDDERFKGFPDLRTLTSEIDQYKGVGEQLNDALSARSAGDWSRVFEIADKVLKAGTAGQLAPRFQDLYADAVTELNISRAQALLSSDDIPEANNILSATLTKEKERGGERESNLRTRLAGEFERIQQAIQARSAMQPLYDQACTLLGLFDNVSFKAHTSPSFALRQSRVGADGQVSSPELRAMINRLKTSSEEGDPTPQELMERVGKLLLTELNRKGISERTKAMRLFRYVGGDRGQVGEADWPPYALSLRTAEARRAARLVADSLRQDVLEPLKQQRIMYLGKEDTLGDELLHEMAEHAAVLRKAFLLETEDERAVGRWVEVQWGKRQAVGEEKQANWRGAVETWRTLDTYHPGVKEVKQGLRNARIQYTVNRSLYLLQNDHKGEDALALLRDLQKEQEMDNAWEVNLALADTHAFLGQFESAFGNIDQSERIVGSMDVSQQKEIRARLQERRKDLESQRIVYTCSEDAKNKVLLGNDADAIRVLQAGMGNPKMKDGSSLCELRDDIFDRASDALLQKVEQDRNRGNDEGKILAITALVDLQTLEELIGQPAEMRRSSEGLNRLRADLGAVAETVIRDAMGFDPSSLPLEQAMNQASSISSRLQTFDNVIPLFTQELEPVRERLNRRRADMSAMLKGLQDLDKALRQTQDQTLWDSAICTGDFNKLEQYQASIRKLDLSNLPEVSSYEKRLEETKEVYAHLLRIINDVKNQFSRAENFSEVKKIIVESSVQPSYRANDQAWQAVHVREYDNIRRQLDDRLRVPDVYGKSDLVGWQKVLEQAEERGGELELWLDWDRECAYKMDAASQAVTQAEAENNAPTRDKKANWEKVRDTAQAVLAGLTYSEGTVLDAEGATHSVLVVGARDAYGNPLPSRSQNAKRFQEEGKRRMVLADGWLHTAETQLSALNDVLKRRGFPTQREFADAVAHKDWNSLEKLLARAREAGVTDDDERKRVDVYARTLEKQRQQKKGWWPRK
jgi:hypothetical protein